jgi:hypothetical protein
MADSVQLSDVTDIELAQYLNDFHGRLRSAEQGLQQINAEISKRQQAVEAENETK